MENYGYFAVLLIMTISQVYYPRLKVQCLPADVKTVADKMRGRYREYFRRNKTKK